MMSIPSSRSREMFTASKLATLACIVVIVGFVEIFAVSPVGASQLKLPKFAGNLFQEKTAKEIKMNLKVLLTNLKVRQVPLAKARSESLLTKLYREERLLKDQIEVLERNLSTFNDKQRRQRLRVLEVDKNPQANSEHSPTGGPRRNLVKVTELTQARIDQWTSELKEKQAELEELRAKINESKQIIKHPDSYIAIPSNYGRLDPEEVQEREREVLIKDREAMDYRQRVESGEEELPLFMADKW